MDLILMIEVARKKNTPFKEMLPCFRKNARVPLPPPPGLLPAKQPDSSETVFADSPDLSSFLLQRMQVNQRPKVLKAK